MTVSRNGFTCEEMYGTRCLFVLTVVRMGIAQYECECCGSVVGKSWPPLEEESE